MVRFIIEKLLQKKWMAVSLFVGTALFISIACLNPIYVQGALQKMITERMEFAAMETDSYPMYAHVKVSASVYKKDFAPVREKLDDEIEEKLKAVPVPEKLAVSIFQMNPQEYTADLMSEEEKEDDNKMGCAYIPGLEEHMTLVDGEVFDTKPEEGVIDCMVSQSAYQKHKLVIGEELTFGSTKDANGNPLVFRVTGVFSRDDNEDGFWVQSDVSFDSQIFVSQKSFEEKASKAFFVKKAGAAVFYDYYRLYDYEKLKFSEAPVISGLMDELGEDGYEFNCAEVIKKYVTDSEQVRTTMNILQVPTMIMLALFIYMVAAKMLAMEQNEISMLKSRGVSAFQIVSVYMIQAVVITIAASVVGLGLGCLFSKTVGVANSFMEFVSRKSLKLFINSEVFLFLLLAALFCILVMTIPVIPKCRATIVEQKQKRKKHKKVFWKRTYIDVIGVLISLYFFYSYRGQLKYIQEKIQMGESVDPTLFLGSSLFILSCSLLLTRMIPALVGLIYRLGRKHWSVASYTAFLQTTRNREKQNFIMIFLVCTVALGIFNANTARTINANEEQNIRYQDGADIVLEEVFGSNLLAVKYKEDQGNDGGPITYTEPDGFKYDALDENIAEMTKVYREDNISVKGIEDFVSDTSESEADEEKPKTRPKGKEKTTSLSIAQGRTILMGIQTKEFGEIAYMPDDVNDTHWYNYLNKIAEDPYGVLVSSNARDQYGLKEGDCISYNRYDELDRNAAFGKGVIVGFVDYFPGYNSKKLVQNADGTYTEEEVFLIVASFDMVQNSLGKIPYERWIKNSDGNGYIYDFTEQNQVSYDYFKDAENDVIKVKNDPVFQETNGLLTIGFLVSLLVCGVGFLIFQIMSIKERELMFGVYRAMGLTSAEVKKMLILEQVMTSLPAVAGGVLTGFVATYLYVPLIEVAYATDTIKVLPTQIVCQARDMTQLAVILAAVFVICMIVIIKNVSRMKISQALKLGEE